MPDGLKASLESLSGFSLDDVQVHYNSPRPARLEALAYTQGAAIHVAPGQERHLAHEAWHVVQQKQRRVRPTLHLGSTAVNDEPALEQEADAMGRRAASQPSQPAADPALRTEPLPGPGVAQRKMGVEYETKWTIESSPQERSANHKKKVYQGDGFYIESDNNDLEFVSFPPSETAQDLYDTVGRMQAQAVGMTGKVKGEVEQPRPPGTYLRPNAGKLLGGEDPWPDEPMNLGGILKTLVRDEDRENVTDEHALGLAGTLLEKGWTVPEGETTAESLASHPWEKDDIVGSLELGDLPFQEEPPVVRQWEETNSLQTLLGSAPKEPFGGKRVLVTPAEKDMLARPQFTFGVELDKIPQLFRMFIEGPKGDEDQEQSALHYRSGEAATLESYGKEHIGKRLKPSHEKATQIFEGHATGELDQKSLGLIRYLIYYIDQTRTKEFTSRDVSKPATRATHVGQEILASLGEETVDQTFPIDSGRLDAALKNTDLEGADEEEIEQAFGASVATLKQRGFVTKAERETIQTYVNSNVDKMMEDPVYPKHFFVLMNRSGFDRMYDSLAPNQKELVNSYVETHVLPKYLKEDQEDVSLFKNPYYYKKKTGAAEYKRGVSYGPTLKEWWASIKSEEHRQEITGENLSEEQTRRDKLSPPAEFIDEQGKPDETQSLGALNKMDESLGVVELREWGQMLPAREWQTHAADMLKAFAHKVLGNRFAPS